MFGHSAARISAVGPREAHQISRREACGGVYLLFFMSSLSPAEISATLRRILIKQKNTQVLLGDVRHVDAAAKRVMLADGGVFPFGRLIVVAGSQTSYYGHDDWRD